MSGGQYVQFVRKDHALDFLKIKGDNFSDVDELIELRNYEKLALPNYQLKKIIRMADELKISLSSIEFYGDISDELKDEIHELIEKKDYSDLLGLIEEKNLIIRKITFYDKKNKRSSGIFSNGIAWIEDTTTLMTVLKNIL